MIQLMPGRSRRFAIACIALPATLSACGWVDSAGRQYNEDPVIQVMVDNELLDEEQSVVMVESGSREIDLSGSSDIDGKVVAYHGSLADQGKLSVCEQWINLQTAANLIGEACEPDVSSDNCNLSVINKAPATGDEDPASINTDGQFTVVSPPLASPIGMTYRWTVIDNDGGESSRDVTFCLTTVNDVPLANDDFYQVDRGETLVINDIVYNADCSISAGAQSVLGNDNDNTDLSGHCLQAELLALPAHASNDFAADFTQLGGFRYTHNESAPTNTDSFSYRVFDGVHYSDAATVTITVIGDINLPPVAVDDRFNVAVGSRNNKLYVTANDSDPEQDNLTITRISKRPDQGGSARISSNGYILYSPESGFSGTETFMYTISDESGKTASAQVEVTVASLNSPPQAMPDSFEVDDDRWSTLNVLANDSDPDNDNLSIVEVGTPAMGGLVLISLDGKHLFYYPPQGSDAETNSFTYTIEDSAGGRSSAKVTVFHD
ncbi:MAG: tandem-95 repeat protein [Gammaproteobacteria bacterium]|nr:tandem-95 repeat protein [Gammaproteobacteria bacterium]